MSPESASAVGASERPATSCRPPSPARPLPFDSGFSVLRVCTGSGCHAPLTFGLGHKMLVEVCFNALHWCHLGAFVFKYNCSSSEKSELLVFISHFQHK